MNMAFFRKRFTSGQRKSILILCAFLCIFFLAGFAFASGGEGGHGGESKGWVKEDTYKVFNFAVLAVIAIIIIRKWGARAINARIDGIREELADLEEKKKQAEQQLAEYNAKLKDLEGETQKIIEEYVRQGNEAKARILKEAEEAAVRLEEQAKKNIDSEFARAKKELQAEVVEKALQQAEQMVKEKITVEDQDRLVDEYLKKVVA